MKRNLILFLILLGLPGFLYAQEKKNQIKTSLFFPLTQNFQISYEGLLNDEMSLNLELTVGEILSVRPSFRYYLSEELIAPNGTFIEPSLHYREEDIGFCLMIGHQKLFKSKISLEAFGGPGIYGEGVSVWGGVNLGIAF
ncbi:MAG: hypothetical protein K9H49_12175 [Bacteroidales bacterium]|nr:hypothetical protein [Bacteroidales bacterium]MCF8391176.1 hypothetical protein [Bacteroidales bacterium]